MIRLVKPTLEHKEKALAYRKEHFDQGENIINGSELLDKTEAYEEWLASIKTIVKNGGVYERSFEFEGELADIYRIEL